MYIYIYIYMYNTIHIYIYISYYIYYYTWKFHPAASTHCHRDLRAFELSVPAQTFTTAAAALAPTTGTIWPWDLQCFLVDSKVSGWVGSGV